MTGFFTGLWQGLIAPIALLGGDAYTWGYIVGVAVLFGTIGFLLGEQFGIRAYRHGFKAGFRSGVAANVEGMNQQ